MVEVMKIMVTSFKRSHASSAALSVPDPAASPCWPMPPLETPVHSRANLGQSLVGSLLLSPGSWCAQGFVCALQESVSPVLCKFWQLYGGVNSDLLQEGLCHTPVCCTQSLSLCGRSLLTCTSIGDSQRLKGRFISGFSIWFHWSIFLFLCQYNTLSLSLGVTGRNALPHFTGGTWIPPQAQADGRNPPTSGTGVSKSSHNTWHHPCLTVSQHRLIGNLQCDISKWNCFSVPTGPLLSLGIGQNMPSQRHNNISLTIHSLFLLRGQGLHGK